jgi:hypothetical protein
MGGVGRHVDGLAGPGDGVFPATDVIVFSAITTQPLSHGPDWPLIAERQLAIFVNGLAVSGPTDIPGPAVTREDIETAFTLRAPPEEM